MGVIYNIGLINVQKNKKKKNESLSQSLFLHMTEVKFDKKPNNQRAREMNDLDQEK